MERTTSNTALGKLKSQYRIPVSWSMSAVVTVEAVSLEEAIRFAREAPLPQDGEYEESSFEVRLGLMDENSDWYGAICE